jgi:hypothetical protein
MRSPSEASPTLAASAEPVARQALQALEEEFWSGRQSHALLLAAPLRVLVERLLPLTADGAVELLAAVAMVLEDGRLDG